MEISQGLCSPPGDALALVAVLGAALGWALDYLCHMTITVWLLAILASSLEVMDLERLDHLVGRPLVLRNCLTVDALGIVTLI